MMSRLPFTVCGKAERLRTADKDHSVCMTFAPMENPKIALAVYVENGGFGADFAVPIAKVLLEQYITGKLSPSAEKEATALQKRRIGYGKANR